MLSALGALFVLVAFIVLIFAPERILWVVAAAVPFTATAGITVLGQSLVMYPLIALLFVGLLVHRSGLQKMLVSSITGKTTLGLLLTLAVWSCTVTLFSPIVFAGVPVLDPRRGIDTGVGDPQPLNFALSNVAQCGYLLIGIATVVAIGTANRVSAHLPAMAFGTGTVISSARYLLPETLQETLFDNSKNVAYTTGEFNGEIERLRGIFSEPSAFGAFSAASAVYFLIASGRLGSRTRILYAILGIWSLVNAIYSFSGGALVTGLVVLGLLAVKGATTLVLARSRIHPLALLGTLLIPAAWLLFSERVLGFIQLVLSNKTNGSSYANRTAANEMSYKLVSETLGIGAGLGSNRPSSFFASILSTIGIPGAILFAAIAMLLVIAALRDTSFHAVGWALITICVSKVIAGPDMSDPPLWFLLGICAHAAWTPHSEEPRGAQQQHYSRVGVDGLEGGAAQALNEEEGRELPDGTGLSSREVNRPV